MNESDAESAALLKSLGLSGLSQEEMKITPSLRNLNQDPTMTDSLVYYLKPGETFVTTQDDAEAPEQSIILSGGGLIPKHASVQFGRQYKPAIKLIKGGGICFVNGKPLEDDEIELKHNDRLILGNSQAFRVVDPLDPEASKPAALIDWDLAQTELAEAMGTAVDLKVEEEVAKKKAELDAQLQAMEEKFARENERLKAELARGGGASGAARLRQMDKRQRSIEVYKARVKIHLNEYKRELIRLEESLKKVRAWHYLWPSSPILKHDCSPRHVYMLGATPPPRG